MWNQAHNAYLESRILSADPMELVRLMYRAAVAEVRGARLYLENRDIRSRSNSITKACTILTELVVSLDRKSGGEYAERLADLYGYMMRRLTEANFQQRDEPLAEVLGLLTDLWKVGKAPQRQLGMASNARLVAPAEAAQVPAATWTHTAEVAYTPQAWSF